MGFLDSLAAGARAFANAHQGQQDNPQTMPQSAQRSNAMPLVLNESVRITLDGNGNGKAFITPPGPRYGTSWDVGNIYVSVATNTNEAGGTWYFSTGIQSNGAEDAVGQTATASSGDNLPASVNLRPGDYITFIWSGGDANALATMTVKGSVNPL